LFSKVKNVADADELMFIDGVDHVDAMRIVGMAPGGAMLHGYALPPSTRESTTTRNE